MRVESCSVCLDDLSEHVEAKYRCNDCGLFYCSGDGKRHAKKHPDHVVEELMHNNSSSLPINNLSSILHHHEICHVHACPINTYCKNCQQVICSACGLEMHKLHDCFLIDQIYNEEKIKFRVDLETLQKRVLQFDNLIGGSAKLDETLHQIEIRKIAEMDLIDELFDEIINKTNSRREYLKKSLNDMAVERINLITEILEMKQVIEKEALINIDKIEEMSKIDLIRNKILLQKKIYSTYDKMENNLRFSSAEQLNNFCLESDKHKLKVILDSIENLGRVNATIPSTTYLLNRHLDPIQDIIPDEFYYDRDNVTKEANLFTKTSYSGHSVVISSMKISEGVVEWRVDLKNICKWIGIGVCQKSVFDTKDFTCFKSPFNNHNYDVLTSNRYVFSCSDKTLNNTHHVFFSRLA